jgi:hypothetical protein
LTREFYRKNKQEVSEVMKTKNIRLALFFIYTGKELPSQETAIPAMKQALQKLCRIFADNQ